jgi:hypothetical protein
MVELPRIWLSHPLEEGWLMRSEQQGSRVVEPAEKEENQYNS